MKNADMQKHAVHVAGLSTQHLEDVEGYFAKWQRCLGGKHATLSMTDSVSKAARPPFVSELQQEGGWWIGNNNLFLRQYASNTCMSQKIIYSLLSG